MLGAETAESKEVKFQILLDNYQLQKDEVIFITDTLGDILEANNAGIKSLGIDSGFHDQRIGHRLQDRVFDLFTFSGGRSGGGQHPAGSGDDDAS